MILYMTYIIIILNVHLYIKSIYLNTKRIDSDLVKKDELGNSEIILRENRKKDIADR
jgi:hypothetical protein